MGNGQDVAPRMQRVIDALGLQLLEHHCGEAIREFGVVVPCAGSVDRPLKPQPRGLSTLLIGWSITSSFRKMTLRCRLSAPELPESRRGTPFQPGNLHPASTAESVRGRRTRSPAPATHRHRRVLVGDEGGEGTRVGAVVCLLGVLSGSIPNELRLLVQIDPSGPQKSGRCTASGTFSSAAMKLAIRPGANSGRLLPCRDSVAIGAPRAGTCRKCTSGRRRPDNRNHHHTFALPRIADVGLSGLLRMVGDGRKVQCPPRRELNRCGWP